MTYGSLFSGIGGMDLGLDRAGFQCKWQVEIDSFCRKVLTKHWPHVPKYGDIRELTGAELERVDCIAGGFPCQPVSLAGKQLVQDDERWLWPEFHRIVRALRPGIVLLENVPGLLVRGIGDVLRDLAESGYDAEWDCIPAAAVGAPHLRYRVFIIAYPNRDKHEVGSHEERRTTTANVLANRDSGGCKVERITQPDWQQGSCRRQSNGCSEVRELQYSSQDDPDSSGSRLEKRQGVFTGGPRPHATTEAYQWWTTEPDVGRVADGVPARVDRLRGLGNAVVPQVAEWIGRRILETQERTA